MKPVKYKKAFAPLLVKYGQEGKSFSRFCADIRISRQQGYLWLDKFDDFKRAKELFDAERVAKLEDIAMNALTGDANVNYGILKMMLQSTAKEYRQNVLNGDTDEDGGAKPAQLNITFTEAKRPEDVSEEES